MEQVKDQRLKRKLSAPVRPEDNGEENRKTAMQKPIGKKGEWEPHRGGTGIKRVRTPYAGVSPVWLPTALLLVPEGISHEACLPPPLLK